MLLLDELIARTGCRSVFVRQSGGAGQVGRTAREEEGLGGSVQGSIQFTQVPENESRA